MRAIGAFVAISCAACGGDTFDGSCGDPFTTSCAEYFDFDSATIAMQRQKCGQYWSDSSRCDRSTYAVGSCTIRDGAAYYVVWYGAGGTNGYTLVGAMHDCSSLGGSFTANQ